MVLSFARVMLPDQVLLPPIRFSRAPVPLMPLPLRMIGLAIVRPLPRTCTAALLATTHGVRSGTQSGSSLDLDDALVDEGQPGVGAGVVGQHQCAGPRFGQYPRSRNDPPSKSVTAVLVTVRVLLVPFSTAVPENNSGLLPAKVTVLLLKVRAFVSRTPPAGARSEPSR